jgi:hypothetical protein
MKKHLTWSQTEYPIVWSNNPYTWDDVSVVIEVVKAIGGGSGGMTSLHNWQKKEPEKKKKLIKLLCIIDSDRYKEEKYVDPNVMLTIEAVKLLEEKVLKPLNIEVTIN